MKSNLRLRVTGAKNRQRVKLKRTDLDTIVSRRGNAPLVIREHLAGQLQGWIRMGRAPHWGIGALGFASGFGEGTRGLEGQPHPHPPFTFALATSTLLCTRRR